MAQARDVAAPPSSISAWVLGKVAPDGRIRAAASLSQSGAGGPWRLELDGIQRTTRRVVVKVGDASVPAVRGRFATEAAALETAARYGVRAPQLVAADADGSEAGAAVLVMTLLPGTSRIARRRDPERLRALGAAAASIHRAAVQPDERLPPRAAPLEGADLGDDLSGPSGGLLRRAQARLRDLGPLHEEPHGLVHGDLWHGNTMWDGDDYSGALDWDFAGVGPAGVDLGSLRCDAVVMYGPEAADDVLSGWEAAAGEPARNLAWWDLISGLSTPPDMRVWLPNFHAQGRTDLTLSLVTLRRDAYLAAALSNL